MYVHKLIINGKILSFFYRKVGRKSANPSSWSSFISVPIPTPRERSSVQLWIPVLYRPVLRKSNSRHTLCIPSSRNEIFHHYWTTHRLHGWTVPGNVILFDISVNYISATWKFMLLLYSAQTENLDGKCITILCIFHLVLTYQVNASLKCINI